MKRDFDFCVPDNQIVIEFKIVNQCSFDTLRISMIYEFAKLANLSICISRLFNQGVRKEEGRDSMISLLRGYTFLYICFYQHLTEI